MERGGHELRNGGSQQQLGDKEAGAHLAPPLNTSHLRRASAHEAPTAPACGLEGWGVSETEADVLVDGEHVPTGISGFWMLGRLAEQGPPRVLSSLLGLPTVMHPDPRQGLGATAATGYDHRQ